MQDVIRQLNPGGKRLSKGHRRIAAYIVDHYDKAVFMTAARLGEMVGVSESTVVRFASSLGYEGYPQLQRALQELARQHLTSVQRFEMSSEIDQSEVLRTVLKADMQNIRNTIDEIDTQVFDEVARRILEAEHIYVAGVRGAAPLAQFLGYYLQFIFPNVRIVAGVVADVFEDIARIGAKDVLIGISFPRYSNRTIEAMRFAKSHNAQVIGITDGSRSPLAEIADVCLTARTDMASFADSLVAPLSVLNALIVALGLKRREELNQHFKNLEGIWDAYRVYLHKDTE